MPMIGFGVFQVNDQKQCQQAVEGAIEVGYRSIDTAASYMNEEAVGAAVRNCGVKREELFVTRPVADSQTLRQLLCRLASHGTTLQGGTHPCYRRDEFLK